MQKRIDLPVEVTDYTNAMAVITILHCRAEVDIRVSVQVVIVAV